MTAGPVIRVNGRGNAWPVPLGQSHPFYSGPAGHDYANASFSILPGPTGGIESSGWEVLVDAGHGTIPMLLRSRNRIPEALVLTHPHLDHILGMDWIVQSHYRFRNRALYPVYASGLCMEEVFRVMPHLEAMIDFRELAPGIKRELAEVPGMAITFYPVYHGPHARGGGMILCRIPFSSRHIRVLFTGDLLCPLTTRQALAELDQPDLLITDANNRFPYPGTNHWSLAGPDHPEADPSFLESWLERIGPEDLLVPHRSGEAPDPYFIRWKDEMHWPDDLVLNVFRFCSLARPRRTALVHYSGLEDRRYHRRETLDEQGMLEWLHRQDAAGRVPGRFILPRTGEEIPLVP